MHLWLKKHGTIREGSLRTHCSTNLFLKIGQLGLM